MTKKSTPQADQNFGDHFQNKVLLCVGVILGTGGPTRLGVVSVTYSRCSFMLLTHRE